ncbi:MAG: SurA N-terminal domain-containing protein [Candidatus Wenzhouxiangella sp. M2_3B_020]
MLQAIRDRVTGIVAIIVLGLLAIPFVFFGLDSYIQSVPQDAVATVGDSEITLSEFQSDFARYRAQLRAQQGENYDELAVNSPEARREFLENMIDRRLLVEHAVDMGLAISPRTVARVVRQVPAFQTDGQFDPRLYEQQITASGQTAAAFERDIARDLLVQQLPAGVSGSVVVTEADVDRWLRVQLESRDIAFARVASEPFREDVEVTEEEVRSFYEQNQAQFLRPERIAVEYIDLDTNEMVAGSEIDEETLRQRYEATQARFMTVERRRASHILITAGDERSDDEARALAETVRERLESGEDFASLARELSEDPGSAEQGGDLGWIEPDVMMPAFEEALYDLEVNQVSQPVKTEFGWHIIELDAIEPPRGKTFEEARAEIAEEIRSERADDLYIELTDRLIDLVYADPTGLEAIAEDLGLALQKAGPFSRFNAEGVLAEPPVLEAAFSDMVLVDREASEPIEVERNRAVVLRVTEHQPSEPRPLDDVRAEIRDRLVRDAALAAAREHAAGIVERVRDEEATLQEVAENEALEFEEREATRRSFELGPAVLEELFRLPAPAEGETLYDVLPDGSNWLVVRLDDVTAGDPASAGDAQRQSARRQIALVRSNREFEGLLEWLRANTEISVVEDRL